MKTRHLNRRDFFAVTAGLAAGCSIHGVPKPGKTFGSVEGHPMVGTQLYGWGQYYERQGRHLEEHLREVLMLVRDTGFHYAESSLDTGDPDKTGELAGVMKERGLKPVSLYTGGAFHIAGKATETAHRIATAARAVKQAGFSGIVCNPDPIGREKTDAELSVQNAALAELGNELRRAGMWLGLHHHTPELRNGAREFHSQFAGTPVESVGFCYDVHWVYRGGLQPAEVLPRYGHRIVSWHLRQSRESIWWEDLAEGDVDYQWISAHVRTHRIPKKLTVELALEQGTKITRNAAANHQRSRDFVKNVFGV